MAAMVSRAGHAYREATRCTQWREKGQKRAIVFQEEAGNAMEAGDHVDDELRDARRWRWRSGLEAHVKN